MSTEAPTTIGEWQGNEGVSVADIEGVLVLVKDSDRPKLARVLRSLGVSLLNSQDIRGN